MRGRVGGGGEKKDGKRVCLSADVAKLFQSEFGISISVLKRVEEKEKTHRGSFAKKLTICAENIRRAWKADGQSFEGKTRKTGRIFLNGMEYKFLGSRTFSFHILSFSTVTPFTFNEIPLITCLQFRNLFFFWSQNELTRFCLSASLLLSLSISMGLPFLSLHSFTYHRPSFE